MKKRSTIFAALILVASAFFMQKISAQAPNKMSYQAVIRNASNALITNQTVGMQVSILQGSPTGTAVYVETQTPTTNTNALVSIEIGSGTIVSGNFTTIDWANGPYFIKTETDPAGGTTYSITGTSELMSTPYALYSKTAETVVNNDDADADPTNELQNWSSLPGIPADFTDNVDNVNDADADSTNEIEIPSGGTSGQVLSTDGLSNYSWVNQTVNTLPNGTTAGQTPRWNGTAWVVDNGIYNDGSKVGIGTTAPEGSLHVNGASGANSWTYIQGNTGGGGAGTPAASITSGLMIGWNATNIGGETELIFGNGLGTDPKLNFATWNGTTKTQIMSILDDGYVGIGTVYPTQQLDVVGNIKMSGAFMPNNSAGTAGQVLTSAGAGLPPTWTTISNTNIYNSNGSLTGNRTVTLNANTLGFTGSSVNAFSVDGNTFSIDASNNRIGIGTATPTAMLSVGSASGTAVSPAHVVHIANNSIEALALQGNTSGTNLSFYKQGSGTRQAVIASSTNASGADLLFYTTSTTGLVDQQRMIINAYGSVGVGVTAPTGLMDLAGVGGTSNSVVIRNGNAVGTNQSSQIAFGYSNTDTYKHYISTRHNAGGTVNNAIEFFTSDGTANGTQATASLCMSLNGGNVGIGTNSPQVKLHVNAVMRLEPLAAAPGTAAKGDMYFNGTTNKLMVFDGTVWQACW